MAVGRIYQFTERNIVRIQIGWLANWLWDRQQQQSTAQVAHKVNIFITKVGHADCKLL